MGTRNLPSLAGALALPHLVFPKGLAGSLSAPGPASAPGSHMELSQAIFLQVCRDKLLPQLCIAPGPCFPWSPWPQSHLFASYGCVPKAPPFPTGLSLTAPQQTRLGLAGHPSRHGVCHQLPRHSSLSLAQMLRSFPLQWFLHNGCVPVCCGHHPSPPALGGQHVFSSCGQIPVHWCAPSQVNGTDAGFRAQLISSSHRLVNSAIPEVPYRSELRFTDLRSINALVVSA